MAHSCPDCGQQCYCGGDIDDCCFEGTPEEASCQHCPPESYEDEDEREYDEDEPDENFERPTEHPTVKP